MGLLLLTPFILGFALALPSQEQPAPRPNCIRMTLEKERQIDQIVEKLGNFLNNLTIEHEDLDIRLIKLSIEQHTEDEVEEKETVLQLAVNDCKLTDDELEEIDHHREKAKQQEKEREANKAEKVKHEQQKEENGKLADALEQKSETSQNKQETQEHWEKSDAHDQTKEETSKNEQETQSNNDHPDVHEQKEAETSKNEQETQSNNDHPDVHEQKEAETLKNKQERKENNENSVTNENVETSKNEHDNHDIDVEPEDNNQTDAETLRNNTEGAKSGKHFEVMYLDLDENGQKLVEAMGKKRKGPRIVYVQERNSGQTEYWFLKRR